MRRGGLSRLSRLSGLAWLIGGAGGCRLEEFPLDPADCDPRLMLPGEVRARRIPCSDELVEDGEGRIGDWLLESAAGRFVVRDTYSAISLHGEAGGTLVDAAAPGGEDVLMELVPEGDRSTIQIASDGRDGAAVLRLPGVEYRLAADSAVLEIDAAGGLFAARPGQDRAGATARDGADFAGAAGGAAPEDRGGRAWIAGPIRVSVSAEALWGGEDGIGVAGAAFYEGATDADSVLATDGAGGGGTGATWMRLPVVDGRVAAWLPEGAALAGERAGCSYDGLELLACAALKLRLVDPAGDPVGGVVREIAADGAAGDGAGDTLWAVPPGGGAVPVGPEPGRLRVEAGPWFSQAEIAWSGVDGEERTVTLERAVSAAQADGPERALMAVAVVAPDADTDEGAGAALDRLYAQGVDFAVLLADEEVPGVPGSALRRPAAAAGVRTEGLLWSWPWEVNQKRPAHGAPDGAGLSAADLLAVSAGRPGDGRIAVVEAAWLEAALTAGGEAALPAAWSPAPQAAWLARFADRAWLAPLWDAALPVSVLGPWTWLGVGPDRNVPAFGRAIFEGKTVAGTGPAISVQVAPVPEGGQRAIRVEIEAAAQQGLSEAGLMYGDDGAGGDWIVPISGEGNLRQTVIFRVPLTTDWVAPWVRGAERSAADGSGGGAETWAIHTAVRLD